MSPRLLIRVPLSAGLGLLLVSGLSGQNTPFQGSVPSGRVSSTRLSLARAMGTAKQRVKNFIEVK
jgi:hypothetical protein